MTLIIKLHSTTLNFSKPILGDAESNAGPTTNVISKTVLDTRNQEHEKCGMPAKIQCTAMAYFPVIFSLIKRPNRRSVLNPDYILDWRDEIFKSAGSHVALKLDDFPKSFKVAECGTESALA